MPLVLRLPLLYAAGSEPVISTQPYRVGNPSLVGYLARQVLQSMTQEQREQLTTLKLRYKARDFANKTVKAQCDQFKR